MVFRPGEVVTAEKLNEEIAAGGSGSTPVLEIDEVAAFEGTTSLTYTDLATAGPEVTTDLDAGQTVVVQLQARITCIAPGDGTEVSGYMSFAISGTDTVAASDDSAAVVRVNSTGAAAEDVEVKIDNTQQRDNYYTAPSTGSYTFTAKYKDILGNGGNTFGRRRIIVKSGV